jgi:hypothetical protein
MPLDKIGITITTHFGDNNYFKIEQGGTIAETETIEALTTTAMNFFCKTIDKYYPKFHPIKPEIVIQKNDNYFDIPTEERPGTHLDTASPEFIKMQIETCKSLAVLKAVYPKIIKGNIELETIYSQKLDELNELCRTKKNN